MPWPSFSAAPTVEIEFSEGDNNVFFLYPSSDPDSTPIGDTIVSGHVVLNLPAPRKVRRLVVELVGVQEFQFRQKAHRVDILRKQSTIDIKDAELPAGEHRFSFWFNVPANAAPSMRNFGLSNYNVIARLPDLGRLGGSLETARRIGLFVNHSGTYSGLPPGHFSQHQLFHHRFGPTLIELSSKHFMVGGYVRWQMTCAEYVLPFRIVNLTLEIVQTFSIRPSLDALEPTEKYELRHTLYSSENDTDWPRQLNEIIRPGDEPLSLSRQMRIPYERMPPFDKSPWLSPSHHPASRSYVMPATQICFTVLFEQYEGGANPTEQQLRQPALQQMQLHVKAVLSSCFCRNAYMSLPRYEADSPEGSDDGASSPQLVPKGPYGFSRCMCGELGEEEQREYGISGQEVYEQRRAQDMARAWVEASAQAKADSPT